jgi:hypothetical protein
LYHFESFHFHLCPEKKGEFQFLSSHAEHLQKSLSFNLTKIFSTNFIVFCVALKDNKIGGGLSRAVFFGKHLDRFMGNQTERIDIQSFVIVSEKMQTLKSFYVGKGCESKLENLLQFLWMEASG